MKLLLFYAPSFWFSVHSKSLDTAPDPAPDDAEREVKDCAVAFYQLEEHDQDRRSKVLTKCVKNVKWLAGKFSAKTVVLHSFGHLSMSKAPADFTREFMNDARERLENAGYTVFETPFGHFNEWKLHVAGESLAKVFKDI